MDSFYLHDITKINMVTQNCTSAVGQKYQVLKLEIIRENGQLDTINLFSEIGSDFEIATEVLPDAQY